MPKAPEDDCLCNDMSQAVLAAQVKSRGFGPISFWHSLSMKPENMPGYRGPRIKNQPAPDFPADDSVDTIAGALLSQIVLDDSKLGTFAR